LDEARSAALAFASLVLTALTTRFLLLIGGAHDPLLATFELRRTEIESVPVTGEICAAMLPIFNAAISSCQMSEKMKYFLTARD
jgi:hypothetical protein